MPTPAAYAHVAAVSFVASRAAPSAGFWVALAGGVATARAGHRHGLREGFGASIAAVVESIALMGPARLGVPLTQAVSAPLLGRMEGRGAAFWRQYAVCTAIRLAQNTVSSAFAIWVIVGGLDAYAGSYDAVLGRLPFVPNGEAAALVGTAVGLVGWALFASWIQVRVYIRAIRRWPAPSGELAEAPASARAADGPGPRFDPRAVAVAALVALVLLVLSTAWWLLAAVAAWLAVATAVARPDREPLPAGLALAAILAVGAFTFGIVGGIGLDLAARRAIRAALLVLVATWLRMACSAAGLRHVSRLVLVRLRRLPALPEAARSLDSLGADRGLLTSGQALVGALRGVPTRPLPVVDAVLGWVAREIERFRPQPVPEPRRLRARARDAALVVAALAPAAVLIA